MIWFVKILAWLNTSISRLETAFFSYDLNIPTRKAVMGTIPMTKNNSISRILSPLKKSRIFFFVISHPAYTVYSVTSNMQNPLKLPPSMGYIISSDSNSLHPIWCVRISAHWDCSQSFLSFF